MLLRDSFPGLDGCFANGTVFFNQHGIPKSIMHTALGDGDVNIHEKIPNMITSGLVRIDSVTSLRQLFPCARRFMEEKAYDLD